VEVRMGIPASGNGILKQCFMCCQELHTQLLRLTVGRGCVSTTQFRVYPQMSLIDHFVAES
jgi:hypothetical protein